MKDDGYKIRDQYAVHFITFAIVEWVDVFTRRIYADIVLESLRYCIKNKGFKVHAWCIMSNHVHLIISSPGGNLSGILRDFKKFTSKQSLKPSKTVKKKAGKTGCSGYLKKLVKKIAVTQLISSGDKIIMLFN